MNIECESCIIEPPPYSCLFQIAVEVLTPFDEMPEIQVAIISSITHMLNVIVTCFLAFRCWKLGFRKTAMHAHLCTVGFMFLMSEGIMVRWKGNIFNKLLGDFDHIIHGFLQIIGGLFGIFGSFQKYYNKETHFHSTHAKLGLMACIFCTLNLFTGFVTIFVPSYSNSVRTTHDLLGIITYILGMFAQLYGYSTGFFERNFTYRRSYKFWTFVILCLSAIGPLKIALRRMYEYQQI